MSENILSSRPWKRCTFCISSSLFKNPSEFSVHLREHHCTKEGGSFVCHYGKNGVCTLLPVEGVSDRDYEDHVARDHILMGVRNRSCTGEPSKTIPSVAEDSNNVHLDVTKCPGSVNLVKEAFTYSLNNSVQNLPAVLNDPRKIKREFDFFTKTWGDSFVDKVDRIPPNSSLPPINRSHFESYIRRTSKRHKKHVRRTAQIVSKQELCKQADAVSILTSLTVTSSSLDNNEFNINSIPRIFIQQNFDLSNFETFQSVLPWQQFDSLNNSSSSSKLLQEKLTHYLDTVEVHIAKQILLKSDAFFHAMSSHDELTDQLEMTLKAVTHLRDKIGSIDATLVIGSMQILSKTKCRANYVKLYKKLKLMATVHQTQATIQFLLSTSDFVGALDLITTSREVLSQELAGIQSLRHLNSQLVEIERVIDKIMKTDFLKYVTADLNRPITQNEEYHMDEEKLVAIIFGQLRLRRLNFIDLYKAEACTAIKALVKQTVIESISNADDICEESVNDNLADQMRMLKFDQWIKLLNDTFKNIQFIIKRIQFVHDIMKSAIDVATGSLEKPLSSDVRRPSVSIQLPEDSDAVNLSSTDYGELQSSLDNLMCTVCDYSNDRCAKLLTARAKDGFMDKLSISDFVLISNCIESFVDHCKLISGPPSTSLKLALRTQASKIVGKFHEERKTKLSLILDNERWKQADVPTEFQSIANHVADMHILLMPKKISETENRQSKTSEALFICKEKFAVVGTVLLLFRMMVEYCQCVNDIPSAAPELLNFIVDLLKIFNSRTCQLILGAGALQLVGLKTITTKNLALACRCLQLVLLYIPKVKNSFDKCLSDKQAFVEKHFAQVTKDYTNHVNEINKMLTGITDTMFENQLSKWVVRAPVPSASFKTIGKQLTKVHEALSDILPDTQLSAIFKDIHTIFKDRMRKQIIRLNVRNDGGPQHGLVTQELTFYSENLKSLKLSFNLDLQDIWRTS